MRKISDSMVRYLSRAGHEKPCLNPGRPRSKAKYETATDSEEYREGKAKRTPVRGVKENLKPQTDKMSRPERVVACLL